MLGCNRDQSIDTEPSHSGDDGSSSNTGILRKECGGSGYSKTKRPL